MSKGLGAGGDLRVMMAVRTLSRSFGRTAGGGFRGRGVSRVLSGSWLDERMSRVGGIVVPQASERGEMTRQRTDDAPFGYVTMGPQ